MYKIKKPSKAQIEVLKKLNEGIFLMRNDFISITYYIYNSHTKERERINSNVGRSLSYSIFVTFDKTKEQDRTIRYYFISELGKQALNGEA